MRFKYPVRMIRLVPGIAIPEYMVFILGYCEPAGHTRRAIKAGDLLRIDYHPDYLEFECERIPELIGEARRRGLRVYKARRHVTVSDGVYKVRLYPSSPG